MGIKRTILFRAIGDHLPAPAHAQKAVPSYGRIRWNLFFPFLHASALLMIFHALQLKRFALL
jgi:hypothetical protein